MTISTDSNTVKVAVFHTEDSLQWAVKLDGIHRAHDCQSEMHDISRVFDREYCSSPLVLLDRISHVLFVYSGDNTHAVEFALLTGYALGKGKRVIIIETAVPMELPENCRHLAIHMHPEHYEVYLHGEKDRFVLEDRRIRARNALMDRGISCFDENFALIVDSGDAEAVSLFLQAGFDPRLTDQRGNPLLTIAVRSQYPDIVTLLLSAGADCNHIAGDRPWTPLMDAVQKGDTVIANILLDHGADPNYRSSDGQTALIICAGRGDDILSAILVKHGADPLITDSLGMSALAYAKLFKNQKLLDLFIPPDA